MTVEAPKKKYERAAAVKERLAAQSREMSPIYAKRLIDELFQKNKDLMERVKAKEE